MREKIKIKNKKTDGESGCLAELENKINAFFPTFQTRVVIVQTEVNRVEQFLEVEMKMKVMNSQFSPLDAVRVVFDDKFHLKMYIFVELLEERSLPDVCFESHLF